MKLYVLAIVLIALVACGAPSVSQDEHDTLRRDFRQSTVDMNELRTQLSDSQDEVDALKAEVRDLQNSLMSREASTGQVQAPAQALVVRDEPKPITIQEAYPDIFQRASKVDVISNADFFGCNDFSTLQINEGDRISVEVLLVRNEDMFSEEMGLTPTLHYFKNGEEGFDVDKVSSHFDLDERVLDNPWNRNSNAYISALYRNKISLPEARYPNPVPKYEFDLPLRNENNRDSSGRELPVPGIFVMQLGDHDVIKLFPSANAHPTADKFKPPPFESTDLSPERYAEIEDRYERYVRDEIAERRDYDRNVTETLERLNERYSSVQEQETECRESLADEGVYEGNLVSGTAIIAWYVE